MALATTTVWEVNNASGVTSANGAGGGFNPSNAGMPTDLATTGSSGQQSSVTVSSASYTFVAGDVNHWLYVKSGTSWTAGWYQITSVSVGVATVNASIGAAIQTDITKGSPYPKYNTNTAQGVGTTGVLTSGTFTVDYSQVTTVPFSNTDLASTNGTTNPATITSAGTPFGQNHVGDVIHITAGTNWTQGWYEIVSVSGVTATLDRAVGTSASLSSGTWALGGTISLSSSTTNQTDNSFFGLQTGTNGTGAQLVFVKNGSYTVSVAVTTGNAGGTLAPIQVVGYSTLRGDTPTAATRPTLALGANSFTLLANWEFYNLIFTGTANSLIQNGTSSKFVNCKLTNSSSTANRGCCDTFNTGMLINCELICYLGRCVFTNGAGSGMWIFQGCYFHDSNIGFLQNSGLNVVLVNCIFENLFVAGYQVATNAGIRSLVSNCTFYGAESKHGIGVSITATSTTGQILINNIFYGNTTGVSNASASFVSYDDYNCYFNNTNDTSAASGGVATWTKGVHDIGTNPSFTNMSQITGTTGSIASANKLTDTTKNFGTLGVVSGQIVTVTSGTGATAGNYLIDSISTTTNTNDTLNITVPASIGTNGAGNVNYYITLGHNLSVGPALAATGFPGAFQASLSTSYMEMGAVQRQEQPMFVIMD